MNFIGRVIRFLFWVLIVSWSVALLRRAVAWMLRGATAPGQVNAGAAGSQCLFAAEAVDQVSQFGRTRPVS